ncbi:ferritin-like protein [Dyadobacter sp. CY326]|nr:ferritin-like protein [Dyadobacter sp. CY326]
MASQPRIFELMAVPQERHDIAWLVESIREAIKVEFATMPPYLTATWSIKEAFNPVATSIRDIVKEEMLHMAIMCNLLVALGETPSLNTDEGVPTFPGPLPGGINPTLVVPLRGLNREGVRIFMEIELPEGGPVAFADTFPTIGAFYSAILDAFVSLNPPLDTTRQLEGPLGLKKIATLADVQNGIKLIVHQGEGSQESPEDTGPGDLAHYYRFGEIYHGKKMLKDSSTGRWDFIGAEVPFPDAWPMADVPVGGYRQTDVPDATVWQLIEEFDRNFTTMLDHLQAAWMLGSLSELSTAIITMFTLQDPAVSLMQKPLPNGNGNYGPCFRLLR